MRAKRFLSAALALSLFTGVLSVPAVSGDSELPVIPIVIEDDISCLIFENVGSSAYVVAGYTGDEANVIIPTRYEGRPVIGIKNKAFSDVRTIKTVIFREGASYIGEYAFSGCSVESIKLPDSLKAIGYDAFLRCDNLKSINVPKNVESIDPEFIDATGLETLTVDTENKKYMSLDNVIYERDENSGEPVKLITAANTVKTVTVPDTVTKIGYCAFQGCYDLTGVDYGDNISRIESHAFVGCSSLQTLYVPWGCDIDTEELGEGMDDLTIYGYKGEEIEDYANEHDLRFVALDRYDVGLNYSDTRLDYIDFHITAVLTSEDGTVSKTFGEHFGLYLVEDGEYTLTLSARNFGTKILTVTVENRNFTEEPDLDLYTLGDANLDGRVDTADITAIKKHLKKTAVLSDNAISCANADRDENGSVSTSDITAIKSHLKGTKTLWVE